MKIYLAQTDELNNKIRCLDIEIQDRKGANSINYMEIKEYSEQMEKARTRAQYEILCFKYNDYSERTSDFMRKAIEDYKVSKAKYYKYYRAYIDQCHKIAANDSEPLARKSSHMKA